MAGARHLAGEGLCSVCDEHFGELSTLLDRLLVTKPYVHDDIYQDNPILSFVEETCTWCGRMGNIDEW